MQQNLVSMVVTQDQETAVLAAIKHIDTQLQGLISLEPGDRKSLPMMGPKSDRFARTVIRLLENNTNIVPPGLDIAGAIADLAALDRMLKINDALQQLASRVDDTVAALGSDVMDVAQAGYGMLKLFGDQNGLEDVRKEVGYRYARSRRKSVSSAD